MGQDKALLRFRGQPMVEIGVEKLREFCAAVSISGNREDLSGFAPIVAEERLDAGPVAGIEAALKCCTEPWAMFIPVDVPMMPTDLLRRWAKTVLALEKSGCGASFLSLWGREQPAFCMLHQSAFAPVLEAIASGERKLRNLYPTSKTAPGEGWLWVCEAEELTADMLHPEYPHQQLSTWFCNLNTPDELLQAEIGSGPE